MNIVLAIKRDDSIYVGSTCYSDAEEIDFPIWLDEGAENKECIVGHAGPYEQGLACRILEIIHEPEIIEHGLGYDFVDKWVRTAFKFFLCHANYMKEEDSLDDLPCDVIFAYKDQLYSIIKGQTYAHKDYALIGTSDVDLTDLYEKLENGPEYDDVYEQIIDLLIPYSNGKPIIVMNTMNEEIKGYGFDEEFFDQRVEN